MTKVIKITQKDIAEVVKRIIKEQEGEGLTPFPPKQQADMPNLSGNTPKEIVKIKYGTSESLVAAKQAVETSLNRAKIAMAQLLDMSGVNPETNNIVADIEKIMSKYESLYGVPKPKEEKIKI